MDPSLQFPAEILPHRCICQVNKGSPPSAVCPGQEFHTDNLPWQPSLAQPGAEGLLLFLLAVYWWAELVRSD